VSLDELRDGSPDPRQDAVDALFADFDGPDSPGLAMAVTEDGKVKNVRCDGMADLAHHIPITPGTAFDAASLAKQFTGMPVVMLASAGRLDLDADVRGLLPDVVRVDRPVTPRQLLHHTSGMRDWVGLLPLVKRDPADGLRFEEILALTSGLRELDFEPGHALVTRGGWTENGKPILAFPWSYRPFGRRVPRDHSALTSAIQWPGSGVSRDRGAPPVTARGALHLRSRTSSQVRVASPSSALRSNVTAPPAGR